MNVQISLDSAATSKVSAGLNELLADLHLVYGHLHALHWNIEGREFFTVHRELQTMYEEIAVFIDDTAERILMLGHRPATRLKDYLETSSLAELESRGYSPLEVGQNVLADLKHLMHNVRALIETSGEHNDEGTADFLIAMLRSFEKANWFWTAFSYK